MDAKQATSPHPDDRARRPAPKAADRVPEARGAGPVAQAGSWSQEVDGEGLVNRVAGRLAGAGVRPGDGLLLGVSGGADSVALLRVLAGLGPSLGVGITALHVHHAIRPPAEADGDANFVEALCATLGVPCVVVRVDAPAEARAHGQSLEEAARRLRRDALFGYRDTHGMRAVVLAHHLDDQAETVLLRLVRGSGALGLGGMDVASVEGILRPFLPERRLTLRLYLEGLGQAWREDRTNAEPAGERNRMRRDVLPLLESLRPGATDRIARSARILREEAELTQGLASVFLRCRRDPNIGPWVTLETDVWERAPGALRREWIRIASRLLGRPMPSLAFTDAWSTWPEARMARPDSAGVRLGRDAQGVHLWSRRWPGTATPIPVDPGTGLAGANGSLPGVRVRPTGTCTDPLDARHVHADALRVSRLVLRPIHAGDRLPAPGHPMAGVHPGDFFRRRGLPAPLRPLVQVVADPATDAVVWVPGHTGLTADETLESAGRGRQGMPGTQDAYAASGRKPLGEPTEEPDAIRGLCLVWETPQWSRPEPARTPWQALLELLLRP